jgi:hypothetical protein
MNHNNNNNINNINNENIDNPNNSDNSNKIYNIFEKKILFFKEVICKTNLTAQKYKSLDIFGANELNMCIINLEKIFNSLNSLLLSKQDKNKISYDFYTEHLQQINNELSTIFKTYGTEQLEDLLKITFGSDYIKKYINIEEHYDKYKLLTEYFHPIGYKILDWKHNENNKKLLNKKNKIIEDFMIVENSNNLDCFDLSRNYKSFQIKVYGIKIAIHNPECNKTMIVFGILDDIIIDFLNNIV